MTREMVQLYHLSVGLFVLSIQHSFSFLLGGSVQSCSKLFGTTTTDLTRIEIPDGQRIWKQPVPPVHITKEMPTPLKQQRENMHFYLLRHGQSTANVNEVISSDRSTLAYTDKHGLTPTGYQQGYASAGQLLDILQQSGSLQPNDRVVFVTSPFARARQTAQACLDGLLQDDANRGRWERTWKLNIDTSLYYHDLLMERYFGRLDDQAIYTYAYVWPLDRMNVTHTTFDVESVAAVCTRLQQMVQEVEDFFSNNDEEGNTHVVCVSHADVLQILQLYAANVDNIGEFSSYRFANGEVRRMQVGAGLESLPPAAPLSPPKRGTNTRR